jgi:hypothetical protein
MSRNCGKKLRNHEVGKVQYTMIIEEKKKKI